MSRSRLQYIPCTLRRCYVELGAISHMASMIMLAEKGLLRALMHHDNCALEERASERWQR
jgi:hypothetical protein